MQHNTKVYCQHILRQLSQSQRRILSTWRAKYLLASLLLGERSEDLKNLAVTSILPGALERKTARVLAAMYREGMIQPVEAYHRLFTVTAPYAEHVSLDERELAMEANPYAALSHVSALVHWGATRLVPKRTFLIVPRTWWKCGVQPVGVAPGDELGLGLPNPIRPESLGRFSYVWTSVKNEWHFGFEERGWLRVMTLERTLLDGLREPELCGGIEEVLRAFRSNRERINLGRMVEYVNTFSLKILRQRAGFVLTRLGFSHADFQKWKREVSRGGSSRLLASAPFAATYDLDWAISINCQITALEEET